MKETRPVFMGSQAITMQGWSHAENSFLQNSAFGSSATAQLVAANLTNQLQTAIHQATPYQTGSFSSDAKVQTLSGFGGSHESSQPFGDAPELPVEELNHLVALLTRQQRPLIHHATQVGHQHSLHGTQLQSPPPSVAPFVDRKQAIRSEPPSHVQQDGLSNSGQECYTDNSCSLVVYAPADFSAMSSALNGGDPDGVALLSSGFVVLPDGRFFGVLVSSTVGMEAPC